MQENSLGVEVKKTALRPFSFERTGGPPPSVVFALSSLLSLKRAIRLKRTIFDANDFSGLF